MQRLLIAKQHILAEKTERLFNKANNWLDVSGLAKLREALALIDEANLQFARSEFMGPNGEVRSADNDSVLEKLKVSAFQFG